MKRSGWALHRLQRTAAGLALVLAGCGRERPQVAVVEVRDSAGVRIVLNPASDDAPLDVVELLRIGVAEGEEPYMFSRIAAIAVDRADTLFVGNDQSGTVRVFSPEGRFVRELGGRERHRQRPVEMAAELAGWRGDPDVSRSGGDHPAT